MDEPDIDPVLLAWALRDLDRLNRLGRTAATMAGRIAAMVAGAGRRTPADRPVTVLDLGCGGGGVTHEVARRVRDSRTRPPGGWRVVGVDASPTCVERADRTAGDAGTGATFRVARAGHESMEAIAGGPVDVVVSSLFLHHLDDPDLDAVLASCATEARLGVVMDDLRRGPWPMAMVRAGTRVLSRCPVVHVDGPRSVRAALTPAELRERAAAAGMAGASVRRAEPARMRLEWRRGDAR